MDVLELKSPKTAAELEYEAEDENAVIFQVPFTRSGWELMESVVCGQGVVLIPSDGGSLLGEIIDTEPDRYLLAIELR